MPEGPNGTNNGEQQPPASMPGADQTTDNSVGDDLPEDTSERTREQFNKLKESNKQLADKVRQLEEVSKTNKGSVLDDLSPKPVINPPTFPNIPGLNLTPLPIMEDSVDKVVDENGYVNDELLKKSLREAQETAKKALAEAQRTREQYQKIEENRQVQQAHRKYPQLDPKSKEFDPNFFEAVKNSVITQMMQGKQNIVEAADAVANWYPLKKEEVAAPLEEDKKIRQSNQTGAANSRGPAAYEKSDMTTLRQKTIAGDKNALAERLKRAGY